MEKIIQKDCEGIDIIGDIHGCYDSLSRLLEQMGYLKIAGIYQHTNRKAMFIGDIVDRGPKILETIEMVMAMCENNHGYMVAGNHEINILTIDIYSKKQQKYLRNRSPTCMEQVKKTKKVFEKNPEKLNKFKNWIRRLPVWFEFDNLRISHAGWSDELKNKWISKYGNSFIFDDEMLEKCTTSGTMEHRFIKRFTCGEDLKLPNKYVHTHPDGVRRRKTRSKFWVKNPKTYQDIALQENGLPSNIGNTLIPKEELVKTYYYGKNNIPLVIGHYCLWGEPELLAENIACTDYGCFKNGYLYAYRHNWKDEKMNKKNFVCSK